MRVNEILSDIIANGGEINPEHRPLVDLALEYEAALKAAVQHLPYHEPDHPDYDGLASDAGRMVRLALNPQCGCSAVSSVMSLKQSETPKIATQDQYR